MRQIKCGFMPDNLGENPTPTIFLYPLRNGTILSHFLLSVYEGGVSSVTESIYEFDLGHGFS